MYEYSEEKVTEIKEKITKVTCNKCGKEEHLEEDETYLVHDLTSIRLNFGYGSSYDMDKWSFELCDSCIEDFISTLKYPPEGFFQYPETLIMTDFTQEEVLAVFNEWKENKKINWIEKINTKEVAEKMKDILDSESVEILKNKNLL
jgi:hypothetical protein